MFPVRSILSYLVHAIAFVPTRQRERSSRGKKEEEKTERRRREGETLSKGSKSVTHTELYRDQERTESACVGEDKIRISYLILSEG